MKSNAQSPSYRALLDKGEPYRLLFPCGAAFGLIGVLLWPAYVWKLTETYPAIIHARIMIECFMAAFVLGFLGTALPRLLGVSKICSLEATVYATGLTATLLAHLINRTVVGDLIFIFTFGAFLLGLVLRARKRQDIPPPAFILVGLGMLSAMIGATCFVLASVWPALFGSPLYPVGRLLLYQGFVLFPVMGVGAFLLPRFFDLPNKQNLPESLSPTAEWWARAHFALFCGALGLLSFALEYYGKLSAGYILRAAAIALYFWREVPFYQTKLKNGSLAASLRIALASIPLGYLTMAIFPARQITLLHIVFITGFGLLTLTVATRVIFGHGGRDHLFKSKLWSIRLFASITVLAMATRVSADWMPDSRLTHYGYAALAWVAALAIWSWFVLPSVRQADD
jgi:uncharacterized protein involved in response to NO